MKQLLSVVVLAMLLACSSRTDEVPPAANAGAPPAGMPTVTMPRGQVVYVEVAANAESRQRGLMFRDSLAADRGMIFLFPEPGLHPFWMKNTLIPLDILWLDAAAKIVYIGAKIPPCEADPCASYSPGVDASYVLELRSGRAAELGLKVGDTLRFAGLDAYRVE
jgi:uncharacterized protein